METETTETEWECRECSDRDDMSDHNPAVCQACFRGGLEKFWAMKIRRNSKFAIRALGELVATDQQEDRSSALEDARLFVARELDKLGLCEEDVYTHASAEACREISAEAARMIEAIAVR